ncbi:hypothetical protein HZF05_21465 [Sphingomonas sp. CGMCC 1.13654]|uniref:Uncharacterized protein n=1 Tax=Sphingomonas chungangi TaxID=2683589 RepID=A0A838LCB6_9SPHN|nr:hypothetical protein [Sphingomonas chungangi]MBA2936657.1 hypothetical protein [Sphingomonas chungangi]MVW56042.1 hypothetical protein [Sphingomonas chungangi]
MKTTKLMAVAAVTMLVAQSGVAAVRPSTVQLSPIAVAQMNAGARIGTTAKGKRSDVVQGGVLALALVGAAGAGVGIAAAAGAFDDNNKSTSP